MLDLVSFVGVDEDTTKLSLSKLQYLRDNLLKFHPVFRIELGFLYSEGRAGKQKRYPTFNFIDDMFYDLSYSSFDTSLHLCGKEAIDKFFANDTELHETCHGANRIQLNLNMDNYDLDEVVDKILEQSRYYKLIIQDNKSKAELVAAIKKREPFHNFNDNINYLYDGSGGFGRIIEKFNPVHPINYTGYAGGINPYNVLDIVKNIEYANETGTRYYIDMESGIRTNDRFDIDKCVDIVLNLFHHLTYRNNQHV
jgi:phosphoribosylanthranilate isomerase